LLNRRITDALTHTCLTEFLQPESRRDSMDLKIEPSVPNRFNPPARGIDGQNPGID
jgi:hypothetical protein